MATMHISTPTGALTPAADPQQASPVFLVLAALACAALGALFTVDLMWPAPSSCMIAAAST